MVTVTWDSLYIVLERILGTDEQEAKEDQGVLVKSQLQDVLRVLLST